ncbi:MAG: hypothetical protein HY909_30480 [Deltaproteobacteria bacterium]|nr:hypothetical protein [Deltaproteobacteria bacterium]
MQRRLLLAPILPFSLLLLDCGGPVEDPTCGVTTFNPATGTFRAFPASNENARKVNAFLQATLDLNTNINQIHDGVLDACRAIGNDLGIPASEYTPTTMGEPPVVTVCGRVGREIQTIIQMALPRDARLEVVATAPRCNVNLDLVAQCAAQCTGQATVEVPRCQPGDLVVMCSAMCSGRCQGMCGAACTGSCTGTCMGGCMGTCSGTCSGTCNGTCVGTCSAMDGSGRCTGTCMGTCMGSCTGSCAGSCSANCMGGCMGTCTAGCSGTCTGECRGGCSAMGSPIRCEGRADINVEAQCDAACEARANVTATCTDPMVTIYARVGSPGMTARLNTLVTSLQTNYPRILTAAARIERLTMTVPAFVQSLDGVARAAVNVGVQAVACTAQAVAVSAAAASKFNATVNVSVMFSASITATGTAQ